MSAELSLLAALQALCDIPLPNARNFWNSREFVVVKEQLIKHYHNGESSLGVEISIANVLRSLGFGDRASDQLMQPGSELSEVASALIHEFQRKTIRRRYLCPLDMASDLPAFKFGNVEIGKFSAAKLEVLFDASRLGRFFPDIRLDAQNLSQFYWLVIEEDVSALDVSGNRQFSCWLDFPVSKDPGQIIPHDRRYPAAVERVLFFLLLLPWEDWSMMHGVDWRGFRVPWVYTLDDDISACPNRPPASDSLSWEPYIQQVDHDEYVEFERPVCLPTRATAEKVRQELDSRWVRLQELSMLKSELFSTPIEHFLVRAFLSDGIDEVMAHLIVIEAAFGTKTDHNRKLRLPEDNRSESATRRVAARLSAAIGKSGAAKEYIDLYEMRCTYIHGRPEERTISTKQRVLARRLAREAADALVGLALKQEPREKILFDLLNSGAVNLPRKS